MGDDAVRGHRDVVPARCRGFLDHRVDRSVGIERAQPDAGCGQLRRADVGRAVENLSLEIRDVDRVEIDEPELRALEDRWQGGGSAEAQQEALQQVRTLFSYLPSNNMEDAPAFDVDVDIAVTEEDAFLDTFIPDSANQPYDMHEVLRLVLDRESVLEVQPALAQNIITAFARLGGRPVGIVANQPAHLAGCLDIAASLKGQNFLPADQVQLHDALDYGGLAVLNDAWSRFRLADLFADLGIPPPEKVTWADWPGTARTLTVV